MKSFCISTPGDVHEWLIAEARRRGCSVSHLLCTLAVRERDQFVIARVESLEAKVAKLLNHEGTKGTKEGGQ